jgi:DegV family protein with EDD domain
MRIGVAVDSACDLPAVYLARHNIGVLPINLYLGNEHLLDARDPQTTIDFYARYASKRQNAYTEPPTTDQIVESLLERAANQVDRLLLVTVSSTRSEIFERVAEARLPLINAALQKRRREEIEGSFFMRVHDSKTLFTGQGILVSEMVRLLRDEGLGFDDLCSRADELSDSIHAYLIPRDLYYVRARARQKGENSVSWFGYQAGSLLNIKPIIRMSQGDTETIATARGFDHAVEKLLEIAAAAIDSGLKTNTVVLSYAGDPGEMSEHDSIREFKSHAAKHGVEVLESIMSTTAGVNVGPGAISLAYAV